MQNFYLSLDLEGKMFELFWLFLISTRHLIPKTDQIQNNALINVINISKFWIQNTFFLTVRKCLFTCLLSPESIKNSYVITRDIFVYIETLL